VAEWTPFQTHYFSENLVAPGIEPEAVTDFKQTFEKEKLQVGMKHVDW
jgi:hypothetical protein